MTHSIRLSRPWLIQIDAEACSSIASPTNLHCTRTFHRPTGLTPETQVFLALAPTAHAAYSAVELNGFPLEAPKAGDASSMSEPIRLSIREHLQPFNTLKLRLSLPAEPDSLGRDISNWLAVTLDIVAGDLAE